MAALIAALALTTSPVEDPRVVVVVVDRLEINHTYDQDGRLFLDQLIGWNWFDDAGWVSLWWHQIGHPSGNPSQVRHFGRGRVEVLICHHGRLIRVRACRIHETWTQFDPEIRNRRLVPGCRPGLPGRRWRFIPPLGHER